jgi:hypothetical protein
MKKIIITLMLTSLFSNQVLAFYPSRDVAELSNIIDSLQMVQSSELGSIQIEKGLRFEDRLERLISKVERMSVNEERKYTKKFVRKAHKNAKIFKKVSKKILRSKVLLSKMASKIGKSPEHLKANLNVMSQSISPKTFSVDLNNKVQLSGGLLQYLEGLRVNSNKSLDFLTGGIEHAIVATVIMLTALGVGLILVLIGLITLAVGAGATTLGTGGVLFLIGSPIIFIGLFA